MTVERLEGSLGILKVPDSSELNERTYRLRTDEVQRLIKERGLTPARLALMLEVDPKTVKKWLGGKNLFMKNAVLLAEKLGGRAQDIIDGFQAHDSAASGMTVSLNVDCATPDEFLYLVALLGEVKAKFEDYRARSKETSTFYLITEDKDGVQYYYYVVISALLYDRFMQAMGMGIVPDFAVIVERGQGDPSQEVKDKVKLYYGFDHDEKTKNMHKPWGSKD